MLSCSLQLYRIVIQFKSDVNHLFTANTYRDVMFLITCQCHLVYTITACAQNIRHQHTRMHAFCQWMCRQHTVQFCANCLAGAVEFFFALTLRQMTSTALTKDNNIKLK